MKLRHKITLTIISTSIVLALVLISLFTFWSKYELEKKTSESFIIKNTQISRQIDRFLQMRIAEVNFISQSTRIKLKNKQYKDIENEYFYFRNELKVFQNIQLFDLNGFKLIDTNRIGLKQKYNIDNHLGINSLNEVVLQFQFDQETRINIVSLNKLILDENNNPVALVVANIPQNAISHLIRNLLIVEDAFYNQDLELIRDDGQILYSNYRKAKNDNELLNLFNQHLKNKTFEFYQDNGNFYAVSKSSNLNINNQSNWYMMIKQSKKIAFKSIQDRAIMLALITFGIIFVFFLISYKVAIAITSPIEEASKALNEASIGNFDSILKVKITDDEFGELIYSLQEMSKKVDLLIKEHAIKYRMAALGKMAGSIAHEINNPLHLINNHAIILNKTLMRQNYSIETEVDKERIKRSLRSITDTVHRISQIISGMKSLSRDGASDPFEVSKLSSIVEGTLTLCFESLKNKEIEFKIERPDVDFSIECRTVQIQQVLLNLINNAADAIKLQDEKWIELNIFESNGSIVFEISNSGPKISDEIGNNIFTPFYTTKAEGQGTGLGLSISRSIVTSHEGTIKLDLTKKHTTFIVKIPLSHQEESDFIKVA